MAFITGSDELKNCDIVLFPKTYNKYNKLNIGDIVLINGKVERRYDKYQLVVNTLTKL